MHDGAFPVKWTGRLAVVTLPEHIDVSNVAELREQLLSVINRGAAVLAVDMTATMSCDHATVDAFARAYQRATVSGTQLRLAVGAPVVRRVLSIEGLDRLVSIYPTLEAAIAAGTGRYGLVSLERAAPRAGGPLPEAGLPGTAAITPAVLWQLIDALGDGLALTAEGDIIVVNRRCAEMFGYERGELVGQPVEVLVPSGLRGAHQEHRRTYERAPETRPMGERARLVGLRKDGATVPVEISLTPITTATGSLVLAVIRDTAEVRRREDIAGLARAAVAEQTRRNAELLDRVVRSLFQVGFSLQAAADQPGDVARERIAVALRQLDDTIHEIRDHVFADPGQEPTDPAANGRP